MKKTLAISFLLLANLVFLAHAVIPHHHHGSVTCFAASHCDEDEAHNHDGEEHHHDHSESSICQLLQDAVPSEANSQKFKIEASAFQLLPLALVPQFIHIANLNSEEVLLLRDDSCQSTYKSIIISYQGLRAPPVC